MIAGTVQRGGRCVWGLSFPPSDLPLSSLCLRPLTLRGGQYDVGWTPSETEARASRMCGREGDGQRSGVGRPALSPPTATVPITSALSIGLDNLGRCAGDVDRQGKRQGEGHQDLPSRRRGMLSKFSQGRENQGGERWARGMGAAKIRVKQREMLAKFLNCFVGRSQGKISRGQNRRVKSCLG